MAILFAGLFGACSRSSGPLDPSSRVIEEAAQKGPTGSEVISAQIITDGGRATDAHELLDALSRALGEERFQDAQEQGQLLLRVEDQLSAEERLDAYLGLGIAQDRGGAPQDALETFLHWQKSQSRAPAEATRRYRVQKEELQLRLVRLLLFFERYESAGETAALVSLELRRPLELVTLYSAKGLALVQTNDLGPAMRYFARGRRVVEENGYHQLSVPPIDLAPLYFGRGEVARLQSKAISLQPDVHFLADLERRCELLLRAQGEYSQVMRIGNAHWSAMSGVRVGELYSDLHRELMKITPSGSHSTDRQELFRAAMRLRYSILLKKAVTMMKSTVAMIARTGEKTPWRQRALDALTQLEDAQIAEEAALSRLPFSRDELQEILDDMARGAEQPKEQS
ncbi:MAG: hypothetical protein MK135_13295 [Polyangiaceae bacterium]|nr:hypothetical protein [Polyangiaceae bacterium]